AFPEAEHPASMAAAAAYIIFLNFISFFPPVQHFIEDLDEIPEKKNPGRIISRDALISARYHPFSELLKLCTHWIHQSILL
ncbi:MAG: hypothetical protein SOW94_06455, partial [Erysipelotrichaceae bacterium]|nr:hypothetical protein [Erysipelotrichaceae bacterium]